MSNEDRTEEQTCGQELAASSEIPEAWRDLMSHVAFNLEAHAHWVGADTELARRERDAMLAVAEAYRAMADAAARAATLLRSLRDLSPAPHDPARFDAPAFASWMRAKLVLQRALAEMLTRHADRAATFER
jgi:hypothetical protein